MCINTKVIVCPDGYQAVLMRRRTPKNACLQIVLYRIDLVYLAIAEWKTRSVNVMNEPK